MPIHVSCPDCRETYHLEPDMLGKRMRCTVCRTVFEVAGALPHNTLPDLSTQPSFVVDAVPMLEATLELPSSESFPDVGTLMPLDGEPDRNPAPEKPSRRERRTPKPVAPPPSAPREVAWSPGMNAPGEKSVPIQTPKSLDEQFLQEFENGEPEDREPAAPSLREQYRRKKTRAGRKLVLAGLFVAVVALVGIGGWRVQKGLSAAPEQTIARADEEYKLNRFENARKLYADFRRNYPDHPRAAESEFFSELSQFRQAAYSAAVRSNPAGAVERFAQFEQYLAASPERAAFADPKRFGVDVADTLQKLAEDLVAVADAEFDPANPEVGGRALETLEALAARAAAYRPTEAGVDPGRAEIDKLRRRMTLARRRIDALAAIGTALADATEETLERAAERAATADLLRDGEYLKLRSEAETRMRSRVAYNRNDPPIPSTNPVAVPRAGLTFASRLDIPGKLPLGSAVQPILSRGMVYGLAESDGRICWSLRVGIDTEVQPLAIPATDTDAAIVLILRSEGATQTLMAVERDTGRPLWQQKLPAPALSLPVAVGSRVLIPLRDPEPIAGRRLKFEQIGLVADIDVRSGHYLGNLNLGRPLGGGMVVDRATDRLYVPGESREVFVFDAGRASADGTPQPPVSLGAIATDHPTGSLRCEPMIVGGDGSAENPGYLVLAQSAGLNAMDLRSFALSVPIGEIQVPTKVRIDGWISFPPRSDPEKLALITDRLSPGLFGINQSGNRDDALFALFADVPKLGVSAVASRAQVISADDRGYRILAGGYLHRLNVQRNPRSGQRLVEDKAPLRLGEPVAPARNSADGTSILLLTQPPDGASIRATSIDTLSGEIRWQRQLGLDPAGDPIRAGDALLIADQSGAIYRIPIAAAAGVVDWTVGDGYRTVEALRPTPETAATIALPDAKGLIVVGYGPGDKPTVQVREYRDGKATDWRTMVLPARPAGPPVLVGSGVVIPLKNGTLVRLLVEGRGPEEGPGWRADSGSADLVCHTTRVGKEGLLFTDGARTLRQLTWGSGPFEPGKSMTLRDAIAGPAVPLPEPDGAESKQFAIADVRGNLFLRAIADPNVPQRTWLASQFGLAEGTFVPRLASHLTAAGMRALSYSPDGRSLFWLDASADRPRWEYKLAGAGTFEGRTFVAGDGLIATDSHGRIHRLGLERGEPEADAPDPDGGGILSPAIPLSPTATALIRFDGTLRIDASGK